jgi:Mn2+/Fe2+ NRAMP family transporter
MDLPAAMSRFHWLRSILPGLALVGFTIGTGSVTAMVKAGADYGMQLGWALLLSCILTYCLFVDFGRLTLVSGKTLLHAVREHIHPAVAMFLLVSLVVNVSGSIMGVMGIVADVLHTWSVSWSFAPRFTGSAAGGISALTWAVWLSLMIWILLVLGSTQAFQAILALLAGVMGICFLLNAAQTFPAWSEILTGLIPNIPHSGEDAPGSGYLVTASMVGTTVAPIVFVFRCILLKEQGWTAAQLPLQRRDARISATLILLISGAVMASAAGTLHVSGIRLQHAREMIPVLEPIAGYFAVVIFVAGITAAGISSQFPNVLSPVWFLSDYQGKSPRTNDRLSVAILAASASVGLVVPLLAARPVAVMLASQAFGAILLPLTLGCLAYLLNRAEVMGQHTNTRRENLVLLLILAFALGIGAVGIRGLFA